MTFGLRPSCHFNPRSLHGERPNDPRWGSLKTSDFNPRSLHGERHKNTSFLFFVFAFQSTLPARGATPAEPSAPEPTPISIHAPCTGSDQGGGRQGQHHRISIHAPCTGSDMAARSSALGTMDFNPRSLHGERLDSVAPTGDVYGISIHAPCTGSDLAEAHARWLRANFNPRSLHGERLVPISTDCST